MTLVMDRRVFLGTFDCDTDPRGWRVRGQMLCYLRSGRDIARTRARSGNVIGTRFLNEPELRQRLAVILAVDAAGDSRLMLANQPATVIARHPQRNGRLGGHRYGGGKRS